MSLAFASCSDARHAFDIKSSLTRKGSLSGIGFHRRESADICRHLSVHLSSSKQRPETVTGAKMGGNSALRYQEVGAKWIQYLINLAKEHGRHPREVEGRMQADPEHPRSAEQHVSHCQTAVTNLHPVCKQTSLLIAPKSLRADLSTSKSIKRERLGNELPARCVVST